MFTFAHAQLALRMTAHTQLKADTVDLHSWDIIPVSSIAPL